MEGWQIENCVLYICTAALISCAIYLGAGGYSWLGLLFLLLANSPRK